MGEARGNKGAGATWGATGARRQRGCRQGARHEEGVPHELLHRRAVLVVVVIQQPLQLPARVCGMRRVVATREADTCAAAPQPYVPVQTRSAVRCESVQGH